MAAVPSLELVPGVLAGETRAIARLLTRAEAADDEGKPALEAIFRRAGRAHVIGITGVPGSGKSTLVAKLAAEIRRTGRRVAIVAIDPSSPFSGGAILGDRIRMGDVARDPGVFVRSMATHGAIGGLAPGTLDAVDILDAAGFEAVVIETVGVGQDEVEIVRAADVAVVVLVPGMGDDVQALKAGIMEIADIFVVNKADREGVDRTIASIKALQSLEVFAEGRWRPPIVKTEATAAAGITDLADAIDRFRAHTASMQGERRRARAEWRVRELLSHRFLRHVERTLPPGEFDRHLERIAGREADPYTVVEEIFRRATGIDQ